MDEANKKQFDDKIAKTVKSSKKRGYAIYDEIMEEFKDLNLSEDDYEEIWAALDKNSIVLRNDKIGDTITIEEDIPFEFENMDELEELADLSDDDLDTDISDVSSVDDSVKMYLKEIGNIALLTADEEVVIAKRMELGIEKEEENEKLKESLEKEKNAKKKQTIEKKIKENNSAIADGKRAAGELSNANLRLVVSIAKKYSGRGMHFLDLIQEGNLGLLKAVEKYDYHKGFKFSTYATWWIRQAITRALADQARTIRIPVHMVETINKIVRTQRQLIQELGRDATNEEIGRQVGMSAERVGEILKMSADPVSLEAPVGEEEDSHLGDFIQDENAMAPSDAADRTMLKEQIAEALDKLTPRERDVLKMRFGLEDGTPHTLEEVGQKFSVTRERIRQIESKSLRRLRHPSTAKYLKDFMDS